MKCEKSMAYKSARGLAIITAVFMAIIISTDAITVSNTLDSYGKLAYSAVMVICAFAESVVLYLMYKYNKELKE